MDAMLRTSRGSSQAVILSFLTLLLGACVHPTPTSFSSPRYTTLDAAALAAAGEIQRRNPRFERWATEWGFNLFRDDGGYFAGNFHTDGQRDLVTLRIKQDAVAAGHSHTASSGSETRLSPWDRGSHGVLQTQERLGERLPHYLVTPAYRLRVWEWGETEQRWIVRKVARSRWGIPLASR